jgi:hypothetical protein
MIDQSVAAGPGAQLQFSTSCDRYDRVARDDCRPTRLCHRWFTATAKPSSWAYGMRFAFLGHAESSFRDSEA